MRKANTSAATRRKPTPARLPSVEQAHIVGSKVDTFPPLVDPADATDSQPDCATCGLTESIATNGVCFPSAPGSALDALKAQSDSHCYHRALKQITTAITRTHDKHEHRILAQTLNSMHSLGWAARASAFSSPLGYLDTDSQRPEGIDQREHAAIDRQLFRHLIGHPGTAPCVFVVSTNEIGKGLYFPHLHATLKAQNGSHQVAIRQSLTGVHFVRSDGVSMTLPFGQLLPTSFDHELLRGEPVVGPLAVLNQVPEINTQLESLGLAHDKHLNIAVEELESGIALLDRVWPDAGRALRCHVSAVVLLAPRGHSRSHSPVELCGTIIMTTGTPVSVGDMLCHESSHIRMHHLKAVDSVMVVRNGSSKRRRFESPWRPDPRPLDGLLLGVHAFLNVCGWYSRLAEFDETLQSHSRLIHERQSAKVREAFKLLCKYGKSTPNGSMLIKEFSDAVENLAISQCSMDKKNA